MAYPKDFKYTEEHEWVQTTGKNKARVGITDYAQRQLGDIVFVELPKVGATFEAGQSFGSVESVKSVSELYVPVSGKVAAVNEDLNDSPEEINSDAHGVWMIELDLTKPAELNGLLTAATYEAYLKERSE
ncbi:glycine cleavage system protein GcvH [Streptomyces sp. CBMA123]|uniref:glycine cleavage system protein GcvH n=1 Tax=Streptomyces sp. CBMA123 TaxID=1896313 RepID=UPI001661CE65|nr:glycine cleavage system protein GcvH [Streptomyces sp. CBMA123]MBD0692955.1 glycine cleavage system protein H [Streptomyces sp. CBMA123]